MDELIQPCGVSVTDEEKAALRGDSASTSCLINTVAGFKPNLPGTKPRQCAVHQVKVGESGAAEAASPGEAAMTAGAPLGLWFVF